MGIIRGAQWVADVDITRAISTKVHLGKQMDFTDRGDPYVACIHDRVCLLNCILGAMTTSYTHMFNNLKMVDTGKNRYRHRLPLLHGFKLLTLHRHHPTRPQATSAHWQQGQPAQGQGN